LYVFVPADTVTTGLLVVDIVVPGSPAHGVIEPGDVLVRLQGKVVTHFMQLEEVLDECVGKSVELQLERAGKQV
jgi:S1-C subfamily serine protease